MTMTTSDYLVEFSCSWDAIGTPTARPVDDACAVRPQTPWTMAFDGTAFRLDVGPVPIAAGTLTEALATMRRLASSGLLDRNPSAHFAVKIHCTPPVAEDQALREVIENPLARLLGADSVSRFSTSVDDDGVVLQLTHASPSTITDDVMAMLAGLGTVVIRGDGDNGAWMSACDLLADNVSQRILDILARLASEAAQSPVTLESHNGSPTGDESSPLQIIPFRSDARPIGEVERSGAGCSEAMGLVSSTPTSDADMLWILFRINDSDRLPADDDLPLDVRMSASFDATTPVIADMPVPARRVSSATYPLPALEPTAYTPGSAEPYVAEIDLQRDLVAATRDGEDPFTFAHLFKQRLTVSLSVGAAAGRRARQSAQIDVFDIGRVGSLYDRLITTLVSADTQAQAKARGLQRVYHAYHPWYPVLAIGLAKAKLYLRAVQEDAYWQRRNLADPSWLMRVGVYLEFLTFLGIAEAVKEDYPGLLSAEERRCFEQSPEFEPIRERIDVDAWRKVWALHKIVFAGNPMTAAGPVDFRNLFQKETANLAFLEVHHGDLKNAVELAGPNLDSGQQTWHHVYRAAERAVLSASATVFPEFRHLGETYQHFVLWHERGKFPISRALLPPWLAAAVGDRDGVYPTAARRYRDSMNEVAAWARERGLMDYAGDECVPRDASLIESQLEGESERFMALQFLDGFRQPSEAAPEVDGTDSASDEMVVGMLRGVEIFEPLTVPEIWQLAHQVQRRTFQPGEVVLRQGDPPTTLNIIERGSVEVLVRQEDGTVLAVDRMDKGDVFGEFALLTGHPVSATVRAIDGIVVHQIPKSAIQPIIEARPELIVELCVLLADRRVNRRTKSEEYLFGSSGPSDLGTMGRLVSRVRGYLLS